MASTNETSTPTHYASLADKLRQQRQNDESQVEAIWSEHVESLRQLLTRELNEIENDTQDLRSLARTRLRQSVWPLAITYALVIVGLVVAAATGWYANHQWHLIQQRDAKLNNLPNLKAAKCNGQPCVAVKTKPGTFRVNGNNYTYMIIQQ